MLDSFIFKEKLPDIHKYWNLFQTTGWNIEYNFTVQDLDKAIQNSWYSVSIYHFDNLIGFGRIISDGIHHALIIDLIIHPDYQGKGIGSKLLDRLVKKCKENNIRDIQLFAAKDKFEFYERHGFEKRLLITIVILAVIITGCEKITLENITVNKYISSLKSGNYDYIELPPFDSEDIPELMKYIEDNQIIKNFPVNPSSSFYAPDCKLGIYAMWTIESIRVCSVVADEHFFRFPSGNPILVFKDSGSGIFDNDITHQEAVKAYQGWWNSSSNCTRTSECLDPGNEP